MKMKNIAIIGGGTVSYVRNHLSLSAVAYGNTARKIHSLCFEQLANQWDRSKDKGYNINLYLTKMANSGAGNLETNEDVSNLVDTLVANIRSTNKNSQVEIKNTTVIACVENL